MSPRVLILSSIYDFAVDIITQGLSQHDVSYLRLNREQFTDLRMTLDPAKGRMGVRSIDFDLELGSNLEAVLYRAPVFLRNTPSTPLSPEEQLGRSQWGAFLRAMTVFDGARWMNHPVDIYQAESKSFQLKVAFESGFTIPDTIATNDVDSIHARFEKEVALKSIDTAYLRDGKEVLFAYTSLVGKDELSDENTCQVPMFAQEIIREKVDLRVTVVGESLWAYRITVDGKGIHGDWRLKKRDELVYEPVNLPVDVALKCLALCQRLRLPFAGIDLMQTDSGFYFVEVNPTGEWAWLPNAEVTVGKEIVDWLMNSKSGGELNEEISTLA